MNTNTDEVLKMAKWIDNGYEAKASDFNEKSNKHYAGLIDTTGTGAGDYIKPCLVLGDTIAQVKERKAIILNAVNNTYGAGINPESIPNTIKELEELKKEKSTFEDKLGTNQLQTMSLALKVGNLEKENEELKEQLERGANQYAKAIVDNVELIKELQEMLSWGKSKDGRFIYNTSTERLEGIKNLISKAQNI